MIPTVHDIAKAAGVSLATVDRVLNNRPGVRKATYDKVQQAIKRIGYVRDISAANLARRKVYRFAFLLPDSPGPFVSSIRDSLHNVKTAQITNRTKIYVRSIPINDPHETARIMDRFAPEDIDGVAVMAQETPQVRDAMVRLRDRNIAVVAFVSGQSHVAQDHFIGIDNVAAGRTAATLMGRFLCRDKAKILTISHSMQARDSLERRLGFDAVMREQFPGVEVLPTLETHRDPVRARKVIAQSIRVHQNISGVYLLVSANPALLEALRAEGLFSSTVTIAHELTSHTKESLLTGEIDAVITQNVGHLVRSALRVLRAKCDDLQFDPSQEKIRIEIVTRENIH